MNKVKDADCRTLEYVLHTFDVFIDILTKSHTMQYFDTRAEQLEFRNLIIDLRKDSLRMKDVICSK